MSHISSLPAFLHQRYQDWKSGAYLEKQDKLRQLADEGQTPHSMVISCSDSRLHVTGLFGASEGEIFSHRNVANFVPAASATGDNHGTAAALQYAVTVLKVPHIVVIGHAGCGGIKGCHDLCSGDNEALAEEGNFVGRWVSLLQPAYQALIAKDGKGNLTKLEQEGVLLSLGNLMSYDFIADAVTDGSLSLHGLWHDIGAGALYGFEADTDSFVML